ncbi:MAG: C39 family peptidase [Acidobacteriales bacterium]|nr:C39 family peptidase [Terriglobales bacterium]
MQRYFRESGYQEYVFQGDFNDVRQHLQKGRPLIAALKPGAGAPLHYVVIAGIDDGDHTVLLNDPAERKLMKRDAQEFERQWKATGSWTLLAVPSPPGH